MVLGVPIALHVAYRRGVPKFVASALGSAVPVMIAMVAVDLRYYFYRDPFAMCAFNHLHIDLRCGPFGYPDSFSSAIYICRMG